MGTINMGTGIVEKQNVRTRDVCCVIGIISLETEIINKRTTHLLTIYRKLINSISSMIA